MHADLMRTALDVITAGSHGMFTRHNALASGHTDRDLRDWVQAGKARRLRRGVFALGLHRRTAVNGCLKRLGQSRVAMEVTSH